MLKKFNRKLETLFEQSPHFVTTSEQSYSADERNIQISENNKMLENLSYVFSNEVSKENLANLFVQLSSYFEIGFLLHKQNNQNLFQVTDGFSYQQKIAMTETLKPIRLPNVPVYKVLKTQAHSLLRHFGMTQLDSHKKMTSYLIPISRNYSIVVMTRIAEPWAALKIETLQKTLMKINFSL